MSGKISAELSKAQMVTITIAIVVYGVVTILAATGCGTIAYAVTSANNFAVLIAFCATLLVSIGLGVSAVVWIDKILSQGAELEAKVVEQQKQLDSHSREAPRQPDIIDYIVSKRESDSTT